MKIPEIPSMEEMFTSVSKMPNSPNSRNLSALLDASKIADSGLPEAAAGFFSDGFNPDALDLSNVGFDLGFPLCTALVQTLKQGSLAYNGHIDALTAFGRVTCSVACVGVGATIGGALGTMILPGPGTILMSMLGGWLGGKTSKTIIESEFVEARDAYTQKVRRWKQKVETSRDDRNASIRALWDRAMREAKSPQQCTEWLEKVQTKFQNELKEHASLVSDMLKDLNAQFEKVQAALRRLRG